MGKWEIASIITHAAPTISEPAKLDQWAEITLKISKEFDWKDAKQKEALTKKLEAACALIGEPE